MRTALRVLALLFLVACTPVSARLVSISVTSVEPFAPGTTQLLAAWFATAGAGFLFLPAQPGEPYRYCEVGSDT